MVICILKGGVVINVAEVAEGTEVCSKAEYDLKLTHDKAAYEDALAMWRLAQADLADRIDREQAALLAVQAAGTAPGEAEARAGNLAALRASLGASKPRMPVRRRWILPDGYAVGEPGGAIGDRWDGRRYVRAADGE
jgi:hypothetical protein